MLIKIKNDLYNVRDDVINFLVTNICEDITVSRDYITLNLDTLCQFYRLVEFMSNVRTDIDYCYALDLCVDSDCDSLTLEYSAIE